MRLPYRGGGTSCADAATSCGSTIAPQPPLVRSTLFNRHCPITMCGIAGIYYRHGRPSDAAACIDRMTSALTHRGPDECGYHVDDRVALGHRRLSIIDLSTGQQPMYNEDRSVSVVFNGEIYNFQPTRSR